MKFRPLGLLLALFVPAPYLIAVPIANPDTYPAVNDQALTVAAPQGVLSNDSGIGTLTAILESDVSNGSLSLNADGSFTYTPANGFIGTDTFTYRASEPPAGTQEFTIVQNSSSASVDAELTVEIPFVGEQSDRASDTTKLAGTVTALITPSAGPFTQIHVTDFKVETAESVDLMFEFLNNLAGVNGTAEAGKLAIHMETPGPPVEVNPTGKFNQIDNEVRLLGTINVTGTGLADGQVPEGEQVFDAAGEFIDLDGMITQSGDTLTISSPFEYQGSFDLDGNALDLALIGNIVATSPVRPPTNSAPALVTIVVTLAGDTDNDGMQDDWETENGLIIGEDDSALDPDGDSRSNGEEFIALTDPQDPKSLLKTLTVNLAANGELTVTFTSTPGKTYQLQQAPDLINFGDIDGATLTATETQSSFNVVTPSPLRGYLRITVE